MDNPEIIATLKKVSVFSKLSYEALEDIAGVMVLENASKGEVIFNQGDEGDGFYIVGQGLVCITRDGKELARCQSCEFFGELSLLNNAPRAATVTALEDTQLLFLNKEDFNDLTEVFPEILKIFVKSALSYLRKT